MSDSAPAPVATADTEPKQAAKPIWFGTLAFAGAIGSLIFCYAQVLISLLAPLFGLAVFEMNIHLQAVFMWAFALVTVTGLARDRTHHHGSAPLIMSACAVAVIIGTLYTFYDIRILILGYVLLVIAALVNQNMMLHSLYGRVQGQAVQLADFNSTLEEKVQTQVHEIERLSRLKRFLSSEVANVITEENRESLLDSHRRQVACLFCDIRNFTAFSETVEPEEVMEALQSMHRRMGQLVEAHSGTIGYRAGDGLMVIFNDPLACDEPVRKVTELALEMRTAFQKIQARWRELGHELGFGIGIAYGYATLGLIGSEDRYDYTAIGNVVNVAARLCDTAQDGEILTDKRTRVEATDNIRTESVGSLKLKGVGQQVEAFKVVGREDSARP